MLHRIWSMYAMHAYMYSALKATNRAVGPVPTIHVCRPINLCRASHRIHRLSQHHSEFIWPLRHPKQPKTRLCSHQPIHHSIKLCIASPFWGNSPVAGWLPLDWVSNVVNASMSRRSRASIQWSPYKSNRLYHGKSSFCATRSPFY